MFDLASIMNSGLHMYVEKYSKVGGTAAMWVKSHNPPDLL